MAAAFTAIAAPGESTIAGAHDPASPAGRLPSSSGAGGATAVELARYGGGSTLTNASLVGPRRTLARPLGLGAALLAGGVAALVFVSGREPAAPAAAPAGAASAEAAPAPVSAPAARVEPAASASSTEPIVTPTTSASAPVVRPAPPGRPPPARQPGPAKPPSDRDPVLGI
jgi:hypothetical protein